ncbi:excinuclease ABC subunit UvrC [Mucisphaera calidilacus]|uniref:UvrABC system protein C n=1 Tax=Mucisphaera calidilacus TaxID=2527982 RepID=A0A518BW84_9BACT|nr:excinuclease ABC subunit UvrC [Mucisphaera calidilacus]QDU71227.1 UvrABC system protein C [Mucisphaera calidilacus]
MTQRRPRLDELQEKARALPRVPGVYLMKDAKGIVIYVGKAASLPDRVSSYFVPSAVRSGNLGPKKAPMLDIVEDFEVIECETEWEALLTENRLIKDIHPRFNARLTDDKTFPYLVITVRDDYPGVFITRRPKDPEYRGAKVYGPFTGGYALREAVQILQRIFRFRTCSLDIREDDESRERFRPCLLYPIKQCTAPCGAKISREAYRTDIQRLIRFLDSKRSVVLRELRDEMKDAAQRLDYERAAVVRDQIKAIEKLDERGSHLDGWQPEIESFYTEPEKGLESLRKTLGMDHSIRCVECIDIAHLQGNETVGSKVCFVDGRPLKNEYRRYKIKSVEGGNDDYASIREVVSRRYRDAGVGQELYPDVIVIDGGLGQLHAAMEVFATVDVPPPMVISLAKKEELIYVQSRSEPIRLGRENHGLRLCQAIRDEAHRFAQHYHHILRRKRVLGES